MGTLADKASKVLDTKQQIAAAIEEKTGENPGNVFADYPDAIRAIPTGGSSWTGHADVEGLKAIGWTDDDIAYYQQHGVNWNEEDDQYHLVPDDNKALYGVINIDNIQDYKDIIVYLPKIDTTGVTNLDYRFAGLHAMIAMPVIDTSKVERMAATFQDCWSLLYIPPLDTSMVTSMNTMCQRCYSLLNILITNSSHVEDMDYMLYNCYSLSSIQYIDCSNAESMLAMLYNCYSISLLIMDMRKSGNINQILNMCSSLRYCKMSNLCKSISISATSLLEKSSLLYMIENAAPTDAITITLSAYCYNKFSNDPDVVAALSAQPLVSLASA